MDILRNDVEVRSDLGDGVDIRYAYFIFYDILCFLIDDRTETKQHNKN
ncbi:hypothetical protein PAJ34TS1_58170 [Paenibacillus azoreducens]